MGIAAFRKEIFKDWKYQKDSIEQFEDVEQIRFLLNNRTVGAYLIQNEIMDVNTPEDLKKAIDDVKKEKK